MKDLFSETDYIDIKIYSVIFIIALFYILSKKKYDVGTCICIFLIWLYTYLPSFVSGGENSAIIIRLLIMSPISFIIQCQYESFSSSNTGSSEIKDLSSYVAKKIVITLMKSVKSNGRKNKDGYTKIGKEKRKEKEKKENKTKN